MSYCSAQEQMLIKMFDYKSHLEKLLECANRKARTYLKIETEGSGSDGNFAQYWVYNMCSVPL